jgi:Reverse transcriptase (RNA-dependent DNA polymerase)
MIVMSLLGLMLWSQPQSQSTIDGIVLVGGRFVSDMWSISATPLWNLGMRIIQACIEAITELFYSDTMQERRYKPSLPWRIATKWFAKAMNTLGDWILSQTGPSTCKKRRTLMTTHRYRKTTQLLAMSVLALQANATVSTEREACFDTDSDDVGIDNRCSACISHVESDFEGSLVACDRVIKGFGGSRTRNVRTGTLKWSWEDDQGNVTTFRIPNSYYVPDGNMRLLSPQHWAQSQQSKSSRFTKRDNNKNAKCGETTDNNRCVLFWNQGTNKRTVLLGRSDNVATFTLAPGYERFNAFCCETDMIDERPDDIIALPAGLISDDEGDDDAPIAPQPDPSPVTAWQPPLQSPEPTADFNSNVTTVDFNLNGPTLSDSDREGMQESTSTTNVIIDEEDRQPSDLAELLMYHHQYGHISFRKLQEMAKQGIIPRRLAKCRIPACSACLFSKMTRKPWRGKPSSRSIRENELPQKPGQVVSVDQLVSPTPGLIAQMTGFLTTKRYKYATVYVDQFSRLGFIYLQKTASAEETIEGKKAFEAYARRHGVRIQNYHADNGIFKAYQWLEACRKEQQGMTFAGVNAHHQNGIAERRIRELQELARTMLIHASSRWKDSVTANLWPYAIRNASEAINHTPSFQDSERRAPIELFTSTKVASNPKHWKPFGSPVYVLDNDLQGQGPFHKWKHRSRAGVYLGKSPQHSRNVSLVLDRNTALVSPQFHVAFDPTFDTVKEMTSKSIWQIKAGFVAQKEPSTSKPKEKTSRATHGGAGRKNLVPTANANKRRRTGETSQEQATGITNPAAATAGDDGPPAPQIDRESTEVDQQHNMVETTTRSGRKAKPAPRLIEAMATEISEATSKDVQGEIFCYVAMFPDDDATDYDDPLLAFKAVSDPDTLYYHEAMREEDSESFKTSMLKELTDQFENGNFTVIRKTEVPEGNTILPAVWQMKRKRDAKTGAIKKHKARLNIDGSRMKKGEHYDMTYSPVASWNSVRMLLTLTALHGWHTKQIDFVQAFAQAPIEKTLYMKIPAGVDLEDGSDPRDYVLKIHRNIYGQKQAGRVWNRYLVNKLVKELGFRQSKVDECVFYRGTTLYVLYTDDSLLAGPDKEEIEKVIDDLQTKAKLAITVEGDLADFLGVSIDRRKDGSIHLTQPHLINQIIKDLRLHDDNVKPRTTPAASSKLLTRHTSSKPFDNSFNYRSVIGKLNYLEKATRSDISYAVHQCARFVSDPKVEHGEAVRWLGRYLKGTRHKGTIMHPLPEKELEVYVDASFCGDWDPVEAAGDRDTARSRHGYIINYAGCPLLWKSQLQTEVALSSTESEYTGLSYALRDAIPIMQLLKEMKGKGFPIHAPQARVHCHVFEDNSGALEMARIHKYRPRTKHLNVRLHHFRDYVERKEISIHPISTNDQPADFLTKALNVELLERHRRTILGW